VEEVSLNTALHRQADAAGTPAAVRGFAHVETWVFDLDNTLYPPDSSLWPQIDARITAYLCDLFGIDGLSARALQKHWFARYGTTLKALMDEYDIDPEDFLAFAHEIDRSTLTAAPALSDAIGALAGRKLILTNGSKKHALDTARALGIDHHFEDVFDIAAAGFVPKPERIAYERFLDRHGVDPLRAAMFEDLEKNLKAPHALGMTTVLVTTLGPDPHREEWEKAQTGGSHVDWVTSDLAAFLAKLPG
jgi:putative hydrolase of the HAD superfamily